MHPQSGGPHDPYGQQPYGQQPYGQPGYGPQPPYGASGGYPGAPMARPGAVTAVRIMTFIAAILALLMAALFLAILAIPGEVQEGFADAAADQGLPENIASIIALAGGGFFGFYGLISLFLGIIGGRQSGGVWWFQIIFQGLMLALMVLSLVTGGFGAVFFIIYTGVILVLLSVGNTRAWYMS